MAKSLFHFLSWPGRLVCTRTAEDVVPRVSEPGSTRSAPQAADGTVRPVCARQHAAILLYLAISVLAAISVGCEETEPRRASAAKEPIRIAIVGESLDDATWPVIMAAAQWFHARYRLAEVKPFATETSSAGGQQKLLADLSEQPFDAVCVVPADPEAIRGSIQELVRHGKRVITFGRDVPESERHAYCGPSQFDIGHSAAQACGMVLKGRAPTIMLLLAGSNNDAYAARCYALN